MPITTISRGDVVLLDFPFSERTGVKRRPAIVVANQAFLSTTRDVIVCGVSTRMGVVARMAGTSELLDWRGAGLKRPSVVKGQLFTVHHRLVLRRLGHLAPGDMLRVDEVLRSILF